MLKTRILTSLVLIPGFFAALFILPDIYWPVLILGISLIALYEWGMMAKLSTLALIGYVFTSLVLGGAILYLANTYGNHWLVYRSLDMFVIASVFWVLVVPFLLFKGIHVKNPWMLALIGWLVVLPLWMALVSLKMVSPWLLLGLTATVWIADSAAYFSGKQFGKHKLAPSISPGKTWEGVLGALVAVSLYGMLVSFYFALPLVPTLLILWIVAVLSVMGDLFESMMKRQANIKDSGNILPGHGGILDRIDGLTSSLPVAVLLIFIYSISQAV